MPKYAVLRHRDGQTLWYEHTDITVAIAEQLVEQHSRRAKEAIARWDRTMSASSLRTAAKNIMLARLYRCTYISLIGQEKTTEDDMPFGHGQY